MPVVKQYQRQQRLPGQLGAPTASGYALTGADRSLTRLGEIVEYRGFQIKQRHDEAKVASGYNEFRDIARKKLSELLALKGENAAALGPKYDEWFNDFAGDYLNKRLSNNTQRRGWEQLALTRRSHDLDILARHEANEMRLFQAQAEAGLFTTTVDDIASNPFDDKARNTSMNIFMEKVAAMHSGEDITALKDKYEKQVYAAAMQAMINDDPGRAAPYLEAWKDILGPDEYKQFKAQLDQGVSLQNVDAAHAQLEQMFGSDAEAKLRYIDKRSNWKKMGLADVSEMAKLKTIINGEYNTDKELRNEAERRRDEQDILALQDALLVDKNVKNAWRIATTMQNPTIRGKALALVENQRFASDPEIYTELKRLVNLDPGSLDAVDIWSNLPSVPGEPGVNADDLQELQRRWEALMKEAQEKPDKYALRGRLLQMADHLRSKKVYSDGARENEIIWARVVDEINDKLDANPEWSDQQAEDWFIQRHSIYKTGWLSRLFRKIFGGEAADLREAEKLIEDEAIRYFANRGKMPDDPLAEYEKLREQAIKILRENNKAVTEETIQQVMDQL